MYQKLTIVGNLGSDPEMRYTPSGQAVTNFRVATNRKWVGNDGKPMEETTWFRVSVWGKQAETCNQYLSKGRLVLCEGRLKPEINIWNDQNGNARASYELNAFEVKFLGGGRGDSNGGATPAESGVEPGLTEDEIPF
jgi:single-strand DNA-binding protein